MLRYYVQKTQDEVSRLRIADYRAEVPRPRSRFRPRPLLVQEVGGRPRSAAIAAPARRHRASDHSGIDFDTFLNYFALGLLIFVLITLFYGIIAIHDMPYEIAKHRDHPHQDAIHAAGWVSLFTLHALWPFLWIWAMLYRPDRGWGIKQKTPRRATDTPRSNPTRSRRCMARVAEARAALGAGGALMELLLILTYTAICVAVFRIFRIPVNKWTLPTAAFGGIFLIGFILLVMNYNHPFTDNARIYFATTPIMPDVKGRVIEVPVRAERAAEAGRHPLQLDPAPYQNEVEKRRAALAEAEQNVTQLKAGFDRRRRWSSHTQTRPGQGSLRALSEGNESARAAGRDLPFSLADVENRRAHLSRRRRHLAGGSRQAEQARVAYESQIGGVHTSVARLRADLRDAEFDLDMTTVRAPGPGFVTQMALRPGMYVIPAPLRPVMVFVHEDDRTLAAGFQQNALQRVRPGDEAEVAFDAVPGRVFRGKVVRVLDAIAPGQFQASGSLQDMGERLPGGRAVAVIEVEQDMSAYNIPGGAAAQVALYTPYWHHFAIIRRILLRMRSWQNYVFLEGH